MDPEKKNEVELLRQEIEDLKSKKVEVKSNQVDPSVAQLLKMISDEGPKMVKAVLKDRKEIRELELKAAADRTKADNDLMVELDKSEKRLKIITIVGALGAMTALAFYDKAYSIGPIVGVLVGAVLSSNILSLFSPSRRAVKQPESQVLDE